MAATFKNYKAVLTDGAPASTVYTVPASTTAIVIGCQVTNMDDSAQPLTFLWTDASDSNTQTHLADEIVVPGNAAYEPIGGKLVLEAGDAIKGHGPQFSGIFEVTVSVLELT